MPEIERKIGDRVSFTSTTISGSSINFRTLEGRIVEFSRPKGLKALVKLRNGRTRWVLVKDLAGENEINGLTRAMMEVHKDLKPDGN